MLRNHQKTIEKNRLIYLLSNIAGHLYILVTIPILTHHLSPDEFGFYTILLQIVVITQTAGLVLFSNALQKFHVEYDGNEKRKFIGTIFASFSLIQIAVSLALYTGGHDLLLMAYPNITLNSSPYIIYVAIWLLVSSLRSLSLTLAKVIEKPWVILSQISIYGVLLIPLLYWFVVLNDYGLRGVLTSIILSESFCLLVLIAFLRNYSLWSLKIEILKKVLVFSAPLAISSFLLIIFMNIDRVILSRFVSISEIGIYSIGFMVGNIAALVVTANSSSYSPRFLSVLKQDGKEPAQSLAMYYMKDSLALMSITVAALTILNDLFLAYLGKDGAVLSASLVVIGIATGSLVRSLFIIYQHCLFSINKTGIILAMHILLVLIGVIIGYMLALSHGMKGVSFMAAVTYLIALPFAYKSSSTHFKLSMPIKAVLISLLFIAFLIATEVYLDHIGRTLSDGRYWGAKILEIIITISIYRKYIIGFKNTLVNRGNVV